MPVYDYQCDDCGHLFEVTRKRTEPGPAECPECETPEPRRAISATSFQLKGSGWYVTDYKNTKQPDAAAAASTSTSADAGASTETKTTATETPTADSKDPAPASKEVA